MDFIDYREPKYKLPEIFGNRVLAALINQNLLAINQNAASAWSESTGHYEFGALPNVVYGLVHGAAVKNDYYLDELRRLELYLKELGFSEETLKYKGNGGEATVFSLPYVADVLLKMGWIDKRELEEKFGTNPEELDTKNDFITKISDFVLSPFNRHIFNPLQPEHISLTYFSFVPNLDVEIDPGNRNYRLLIERTRACLEYEGLEVSDPKPANWGFSSRHPDVLFLLDIGAVSVAREKNPNRTKPDFYDEMKDAAIKAQAGLHEKYGYGLTAVEKIAAIVRAVKGK